MKLLPLNMPLQVPGLQSHLHQVMRNMLKMKIKKAKIQGGNVGKAPTLGPSLLNSMKFKEHTGEGRF